MAFSKKLSILKEVLEIRALFLAESAFRNPFMPRKAAQRVFSVSSLPSGLSLLVSP
jgi:hypothetical protein